MLEVKNLLVSEGNRRDTNSILEQEDPLEEGTATHSSILAGQSHGQRSPAGCGAYGHKESDTTGATEHAWDKILLILEKEQRLGIHSSHVRIEFHTKK